ncbi:CBS domain-containing protein [Streptomyces erythrochromogenes]|uniref:CBS domain-containing protein n=1 Tax=Streptomyces erythrochromogenes TaxID=285574 RepID=UPI0033E98FC2
MTQTPSAPDIAALKGKSIHVKELLTLFGLRNRDDQAVLLVGQALKDAGLTTVPSFATCGHGIPLHIQVQETIAPADAVIESEADEGEEDDLPAGALPQQALKVGDMLVGKGGFVSLEPTAQLSTATYLMRQHGFSQLPVVASTTTLHGVVTWSSVVKVYETNKSLTLANALETDVPVAEEQHDFFSILPRISEKGYVLVRGSDGAFKGIVTASDITERFTVTARPFFMVGEIELRLRKCLGTVIAPEAIKAVQKFKKTGLVADLTLGAYVKLLDCQQSNNQLRLRAEQNWADLKWDGVDRVMFVHQLAQVRDIRNRIAHFDPQPLPEVKAEDLRKFVQLLRDYVPDL